jgi:CRISPR/Cas system CSM-associated protein Csm4 (group 5 of RAMP superfamily)
MRNMEYKTHGIIDGKVRQIIVDENGSITNKKPSKEDLNKLDVDEYKRSYNSRYTDKELINYLMKFYEENGRIPVAKDFQNDSRYPHLSTYQRHFGSWQNALRIAGLDIDSMVNKGVLENNTQKGRYGEIKVLNHFKQHPIDLSGNNSISHCDGICPNGMLYDVKSAAISKSGYYFRTANKFKEEIEIYYLLAFNENYQKLDYGWRIPGELAERNGFYVGQTYNSEYNIQNLEEYDITDKIKDILT